MEISFELQKNRDKNNRNRTNYSVCCDTFMHGSSKHSNSIMKLKGIKYFKVFVKEGLINIESDLCFYFNTITSL